MKNIFFCEFQMRRENKAKNLEEKLQIQPNCVQNMLSEIQVFIVDIEIDSVHSH